MLVVKSVGSLCFSWLLKKKKNLHIVIIALLLNCVCVASSRFSLTELAGGLILLSVIGDLCNVELNPDDLEMWLRADVCQRSGMPDSWKKTNRRQTNKMKTNF